MKYATKKTHNLEVIGSSPIWSTTYKSTCNFSQVLFVLF